MPVGCRFTRLIDIRHASLALKEGRTEAGDRHERPEETGSRWCRRSSTAFLTAVLATVHAGAWRLDWIAGILVLLCSVPCCGVLQLLARSSGGDACDCEIKFIEALMEELGAGGGDVPGGEADGKRIDWCWFLKRKGAGSCMVTLRQYQKVEYAECGEPPDRFPAG